MLTSRVDRNSIPFDIMKAQFVLPLFASTSLLAAVACAGETSPASLPGQLPRAMHMPMSGGPHITVGLKEGGMRNADMGVSYVFVLGIEALVAVGLSAAYLHESFSPSRIAAVLLVVAGVVWLRRT